MARPIGFHLTEEEKETITRFTYITRRTIGDVAKEMGISYFSLYNPLNDRRGCSRKILKKIRRGIVRFSDVLD